ncbi:MAG: hypothetical protein H6745_33800 [Deltaproteobacteria bacterium]|nr:hypothetical protein [Deltaproteobacteria bacterium]
MRVEAAQLRLAAQTASAPPPWPKHVQAKGPAPVTALGAPAAQRPAVGAAGALWPAEGPQAPAIVWVALQEAVAPPFSPTHDHVKTPPAAVTAVAAPLAQRPVAGAVRVSRPAAAPHAPSTMAAQVAPESDHVPCAQRAVAPPT